MFGDRRWAAMLLLLILPICVFASPLTVYDQPGLAGTGTVLPNLFTVYSGAEIPGGLNNSISSFQLDQGYMVVIADSADGLQPSKTYIANDAPLTVNTLPVGLDNTISFIRIVPWNNTIKKGKGGWVSDPSLGEGWYYNWGKDVARGQDQNSPYGQYVPMSWGAGGAGDDDILDYLAMDQATHLLGFNEPDRCDSQSGQYNNLCDVNTAVNYYKNLQKAGLRLGSPAGHEEAARNESSWTSLFIDQCEAADIRIDFVGLHWYDWGGGPAATPNEDPYVILRRLKVYLSKAYHMYRRPLWITEFNANPNRVTSVQNEFLQIALPYLESVGYIERYAWFQPVSGTGDFFDDQGQITSTGQIYNDHVSAPAYTSKELSVPWQDQDIGAVAKSGDTIYANGSFTVCGSGVGITGAADEFRYVYQPVTGDASVIARVNYLSDWYGLSRGGVMIRETLDTGSKHAHMCITASSGAAFQSRTAVAGSTASVGQSGIKTPSWVKLERQGNVLTGSYSEDGSVWVQLGSQTIAMNDTVYIGMASSSHSDGNFNDAVFTDVAVWGESLPNILPVFSVDPINKPNAGVGLSYNDTIADVAYDVESDQLSFSKISGPSWLSVAVAGQISGIPLVADLGLNAFTVQIDDGDGGTDTAILNILVTTNTPPSFSMDPITMQNATINMGYSETIAGLATDADSDPLSFSKVSGPTWLHIMENGSVFGVPEKSDLGPNTFVIRVDDGQGGVDTATLNISVDPLFYSIYNDDFENGWGHWVSGGSDALLSANNAIGSQCMNLQDNSGDASSIWLESSINLSWCSQLKIEFTYLPVKMETGEDFWVQFSDDGGSTWTPIKSFISGTDFNNDVRENPTLLLDRAEYNLSSNVNIRFQCDASDDRDDIYIDNIVMSGTLAEPPNNAPVFTSDPISVGNAAEGVAYSETIADLATDADSDPLIYSKVSGSSWLNIAGTGALSGTPVAGDSGLNVFTVQVDDGAGGSDITTLNITVEATPNQPPIFTIDPINEANATEDAAYSGSVANAMDADTDPLTYSKASGPAWLSVAAGGALSGTPGNGDVGLNTFTVQVDDGNGDMDIATLNITVDNVNDAPVWSAGPIEEADATEDAVYSSTLADDAGDVDAEASLTYATVSGPSWLNIGSDGALSGMPVNDDIGTNSWVVSVSDGIDAPVEATLKIVVINVNDAPQFTVDPINEVDATADVAFSGTVANASDDDGDVLAYSKVSGPVWLSVAENGALSGIPEQSDAGPNNWTVQVLDGNGGTNTATLNIQVLALLAGYDAWITSYGLSGNPAFQTNDYDLDGKKNLYEYGLDGDPTNNVVTGTEPVYGKVILDGGTNWIEYVHLRRTNANHGLLYTIIQTGDLVDQPWSNSLDSIVIGSGPALNSDFITVTNRVPVNDNRQQFLRLRIEQQ